MSRRAVFLSLSLLVAPSLLACDVARAPAPAAAPATTTQHAIKGGYDDPGDTAILGFAKVGGGGFGTCSGTLISPNVVLTARHCVAPTLKEVEGGGVDCATTVFGSTYKPTNLYVTPDQYIQMQGIWFQGEEVHVPPGGSMFCGNDLALVVLSEPVPSAYAIPIIPRVDEPIVADTPWIPGSGELYSAAGYGETEDDRGDSGARRRRDGLQATCFEGSCGGYPIGEAEWVGDTGVCSGDSGGPALDRLGRVIGVASRGGPGCTSPIYGSVYGWAGWIMDVTRYAAEQAGLPTPGWAIGQPTDPKYHHPVGVACAAKEQCASGICRDGYCTRYCLEAAPCPGAFYCDAAAGTCAALPVGVSCAADSACGLEGTCRAGLCTRRCDAGLSCPEGWTCPGGGGGVCELLAVGGSCGAATDCATGACTDGLCTRSCHAEAPCPEGWVCDAAGECALVAIGATCAGDAACDSGACREGVCTRACSPDSPCPSGWLCGAAGLCEQAKMGGACEADAECDGGNCVAGLCTRGCGLQSPCLDGWTCGAAGVCELPEVGGACAGDAECGGGTCQGGVCTRGCSEAAPCPTGYACGAATGVCAALPQDEGCASAPAGGAAGLGWLAALLALAALAGRRRRAA